MKRACLHPDRLSNLPSSLVQTILTLMPIRDAFRTTILSRNWRHYCLNLPKLEFDNNLLKVSTNTQLSLSIKCKLFHAIYTVLLLHYGPVLEFSLCVSKLPSCYEIDQIILHLAKNATVEKFNLSMGSYISHKLPSSFFSLRKLTHINLKNCAIELQSTSFRFERLTSLHFHNVSISNKTLIFLISCCPILKSFTWTNDEQRFITGMEYIDLVQLLQLLPSIEHLEMKCFVKGVVPQSLRNMPVHLGTLILHGLSFGKENELRFVLLLVTNSPNIKKIKLEMGYNQAEVPRQTAMKFFNLQDYSYVKLDHLGELEVTNFSYTRPGMHFLKLILSKSPVLKKVRVVINNKVCVDDEVEMLRDLLWNPCAAAGAKIKVERS